MAYSDLREWIKALDKEKEIKYIKHEVDPILEISEIADRVSKAGQSGGLKGYAPGGPALMFERVKGYTGTKVLMNQFGSERWMCLALGVESLVLCGIETDSCVMATAMDAHMREYAVRVPSNGTGSSSPARQRAALLLMRHSKIETRPWRSGRD